MTRTHLPRFMLTAFLGALAMFLLVLGISWPLLQLSRANLRDQTRNELITLAKSASILVDARGHHSLEKEGSEKSATYRRAIAPLERFQKLNPEVAFVYTMIRRGDQILFVLDPTDPSAKTDDQIDKKSYPMEVYDDAPPDVRIAFRSHTPVASTQLVTDKWGTFMSGFAPLLDPNGEQYGVVGVDLEVSSYQARFAEVDRAEQMAMLMAMLSSIVTGLAILAVLLNSHRSRSQIAAAAGPQEVGLAEARQAVEQARRGRDVFIASMITDLVRPLAAIAQTASRLLTETQDPFQQNQLHTLIGETEHLRNLVAEARNLAVLESSEATLQRTPLNPALELNFAVGQASGLRRFKGRRIELETTAELSTLAKLPHDRTRQIFATMIEAVAAGTNGDILVSGSTENRGGVIWMHVEVSGARFGWNKTEEDHEHAIEHTMAGVLSRRIAQILGGTILVENTAAQLIWRLQVPLPPSNLWSSAA